MMTSSNGNICRVTGHLCGEFTGHRWIPAQRPVTRSFDVFFDLCLNKQLSKQSWGWWFWTPSCPLWRHCNVMYVFNLQAIVSATIRLFHVFGGDSSHTPFFDWQGFQGNTLYPLAIIHMEHINVLDFDDKSERNLCFWTFSFGNSGIIFKVASAQLFPPREKW